MAKKNYTPYVITTKEQLLKELESGDIKSAKYNLLKPDEKELIGLMCFADYTADQAGRKLYPKNTQHRARVNKMLANPDVKAAMDELADFREGRFLTEISSAKELALNKLKYIMNTSTDESVQAACAKAIIDQSNKLASIKAKKEDTSVSEVKFSLEVDYVPPVKKDFNPEESVVVDIEEEEDRDKDLAKAKPLEVDEDTGLSYKLDYEEVDNYNDKKD